MAQTQPTNWIPDRKVFAGGIAGLAAFFAVLALRKWADMEIDAETAMALVGIAGSAVAYWVPPSVKDRAARLDQYLKEQFRGEASPGTLGGSGRIGNA